MKGLVLYRSYHGNTTQVAESIAGQFRALQHEAGVHDLRRRLPDLSRVDVIVIGSPTRMARVNRKARRVLKRLSKKGFAGKPIAVFDTYGPVPSNPEELEKGRKWLYPGAAGILQQTAKSLGLNVYSETLRCEVQGMKGPLKEKELEKAVVFTNNFLSTIGKKS
jgi:menaquinone-dependent protoporphyrinogen IX oxidase